MNDYLIPISKIIIFIFFLYKIGIILGFIFYFLCFNIYIKIVEKLLNYEQINGSDLMFLWEYENSPNIIISNIIIDRMNYADFKQFFNQNAVSKFRRLRQKVTKYLGEYYWEEINFENTSKEENIEKKNINSISDVLAFNEKMFPIHIDFYKNPLWKIYFVENFIYDEEKSPKSMIIFKYHHALGDGIGLINLFSSLSKNLNLKNYLQVKKISILDKIVLYLLSPYYLIKSQPVKDNTCKNPFEKYGNKSPTIEKKIAMTKKFKFSNFKKIYSNNSKYPKATFNDLSWTLIVRSLLKFINNNLSIGEENYTSITGIMAISGRTELNEYDMGNQSLGQLVNFKYENESEVENFEKCFTRMREVLKPIKNKNKIISSALLGSCLGSYFFTEKLVKSLAENAFKSVSFIYTNVRGPSEKIQLKNYTDSNNTEENIITENEVEEIFVFVPHGKLVFSILAFSYNGFIRFSFHADKINGPNVEEMAKYLELEIENIFKLYNL
jgi:hypothetical protein